MMWYNVIYQRLKGFYMNMSYQEWLNSLDNFHIQTILAELIENPSLEIYGVW